MMTRYEIISLIISFLGLGTAFFSFVAARNSEKSAKESAIATSLIEKGMLEMQIRSSINESSNRRDDLMIRLQTDTKNKALVIASESALENWINTYDEACGLYIDGKVDKQRFKKNYYNEIVDLVQDKNFDEYFNPEFKSKYQKMIIVYKEWTNLEFTQK